MVQIWDHASGKLRKDLEYQAEEKFMMHNGAVLALNFSRDSELLVSGSQDGKIKVPLDGPPAVSPLYHPSPALSCGICSTLHRDAKPAVTL